MEVARSGHATNRTVSTRRGHDAVGWGLGVVTNEVEALRDQMIDRVREQVDRTGEPVNLVGWSLGGGIAREVARNLPTSVNRVATYGTPVLGGPTHTVGATAMGKAECERITTMQEHLDEMDPIKVPITAIFTRKDGAVDWRSCIDRSSENVTMLEVSASHAGLGLNPHVWVAVAEALSENVLV